MPTPTPPSYDPTKLIPPWDGILLDSAVIGSAALTGQTTDNISGGSGNTGTIGGLFQDATSSTGDIVIAAPQSVIVTLIGIGGIGVGGTADFIVRNPVTTLIADGALGIGGFTTIARPVLTAIGSLGIGGTGTIAVPTSPIIAIGSLGIGGTGTIQSLITPLAGIGGLGIGGDGVIRPATVPVIAIGSLGIGGSTNIISPVIAIGSVGIGGTGTILPLITPLTVIGSVGIGGTGDYPFTRTQLNFTVSQSSVFGATGNQGNLTDNLTTSGAGTNTAATSWIALDFSSAQTIQGFVVAAGSLTGFGGTSTYLNSAALRSSPDSSTWTTQATVSGMSDTANSSALFKYISVGGVSARYWRLERTSNYVATTEFQPVGSQSFSYPQTLTYQSGGDTNGVFYYLGYSTFGTAFFSWSNPAVLGNVTVTGSATVSTGNLYNLSDRNNSTAILTATSAGQTITVDFGSGRSFRLNSYTLRTSGNTNGYPRNWNMRGSNDNTSYTNIDVRSADTTANAANTWFNYTCNQGNTNSYRYIQFQLNGTNSGGSNLIDLSEWEFYGVLS